MREYGKIKTGFWHNKKARVLTDDAKLLLIYLISCPHGNSIGCFVLPMGYITEDMDWSQQKASDRLKELAANGFIERDEETRVVRLTTWWEHNSIENGNVAKGVVSIAENLPPCLVSKHAVDELLSLSNTFLNSFQTRLNLVSDEFGNNKPEPEPETNPSELQRNSQIEFDEQFERIWSLVPKKVDKMETKREFKAALRDADIETIISRVRLWRASVAGKETRFVMSPRRWFHGKHWNDELDLGIVGIADVPRMQVNEARIAAGLDPWP
jgi:hypothetical protein